MLGNKNTRNKVIIINVGLKMKLLENHEKSNNVGT